MGFLSHANLSKSSAKSNTSMWDFQASANLAESASLDARLPEIKGRRRRRIRTGAQAHPHLSMVSTTAHSKQGQGQGSNDTFPVCKLPFQRFRPVFPGFRKLYNIGLLAEYTTLAYWLTIHIGILADYILYNIGILADYTILALMHVQACNGRYWFPSSSANLNQPGTACASQLQSLQLPLLLLQHPSSPLAKLAPKVFQREVRHPRSIVIDLNVSGDVSFSKVE